MKKNLRVWLSIKAYVLVINLCIYCPAIGAETINKPSPIESATTPQRNERAELYKSGLQGGESGTKNVVNSHAIARPVNGMRVKAIEGGKNGGTESGASIGSASFKSIAPSKVSAETGRQNSGNDAVYVSDNYFGHWLLLGTIIALWIIFQGAAAQKLPMKHN